MWAIWTNVINVDNMNNIDNVYNLDNLNNVDNVYNMDNVNDLDNVDYVVKMDEVDNINQLKRQQKREPKKEPKRQSGFLDKTILHKQFENIGDIFKNFKRLFITGHILIKTFKFKIFDIFMKFHAVMHTFYACLWLINTLTCTKVKCDTAESISIPLTLKICFLKSDCSELFAEGGSFHSTYFPTSHCSQLR